MEDRKISSRNSSSCPLFSCLRKEELDLTPPKSIRLGRPLKWNPETEQIVGDDAANAWLRRDQRKGFEIVVS